MELETLCQYLDDRLGVTGFPDYPGAHNGLQLACRGEVRHLAVAVDACQATLEAAVAASADLLIVHHGLLWGGGRPIVGPVYRRLATAIGANLGVYSAHLPLDAHPELGNNACLIRALGLTVAEPFGEHEGRCIGFTAGADLDQQALADRLAHAVEGPVRLVVPAVRRIRRLAVVTGGGASFVAAAHRAGCDALVTGEAPHHAFHEAEELGVGLLLGGHYATESLGVKAVASELETRFGLSWCFLDYPTGL
jgi:dinuclear metal center YbgI/SA1388 family protein